MFALDSRLQQDCLLVGDFPLCRLLLMNDSNYPWFILVPRREEVSELFQLDADDQRQLWQETTLLAEILKDTFAADKMNVATLGNVVSQLHVHVIVRRRDDVVGPHRSGGGIRHSLTQGSSWDRSSTSCAWC